MSEDLAAQAIATSLLEAWGGGVQKDAFARKSVGKWVGKGVDKGIGKLMGNQAAGASIQGGKALARGAFRSAAGVKPGQAAFQKPLDYVTKPLRAVALPNLGKPLNYTRAGLFSGFVGHQGYKGYGALGDAAKEVDLAASDAWRSGASQDVVQDMRRYNTRSGLLQAWLRGHGAKGPLTGHSPAATDRQRLMDKQMGSAVDDLTFGAMSRAHKALPRPHEFLNPLGSILARGGITRAGNMGGGREANENLDHLREQWKQYNPDGQSLRKGLLAHLSR